MNDLEKLSDQELKERLLAADFGPGKHIGISQVQRKFNLSYFKAQDVLVKAERAGIVRSDKANNWRYTWIA